MGLSDDHILCMMDGRVVTLVAYKMVAKEAEGILRESVNKEGTQEIQGVEGSGGQRWGSRRIVTTVSLHLRYHCWRLPRQQADLILSHEG